MGFLLACPNCGERSYLEFTYGGELRAYDPFADDEQDYRNTWLRENRFGPQDERWFHFAGCCRWVQIRRDTRDNSMTPANA